MPLTLSELPSDHQTDDIIERTLYARDLAPVPAIMTSRFFRTLPDAVVRPANAAQVAEVLRAAAQQRLPVTPRAAASTSYYNAVPVRGGLVLDVNDLRDGIHLDAGRQTVRVLPATTWFELDDALQQQGFAVQSYPSSAVAATVGGWVSTQGHGIGSLRYGALRDQLVSLDVVLPSGELQTVTHDSDPPLSWFVAAEGTLGVITAVELMVRHLPAAERHDLWAFDRPDAVGASVRQLVHSQPTPYTVFFADGGYLQLLAAGGFQTPIDPSGPDQGIILVSYQGEPAEVRQAAQALAHLPGRALAAELAIEEWSLRFFHLRTKRAGPSLLAAEMWLPLARLDSYLVAVKQLAVQTHQTIGTYGLAVTPDLAQVMSIYPADERQTWSYLAALGFTKRLHDLGARNGGTPYGVGLWNTPYLSRLFSKKQLVELRQRKARLDPLDLMNPGKLYAASFPLWSWSFGLGAAALGRLHTLQARRRA